MPPDVAELLLAEIRDPYQGLTARLRAVTYQWSADGLTVGGNFFYLAFGADDTPTVDGFVELIRHKIIHFCVPRTQFDRAKQRFVETNDPRYIEDLTEQGRGVFVRAAKSRLTSGEPGELILFVLLEGHLRAPQIACKMSLKTNANVHVLGADSVHAMAGSAPGRLRLVWGESKVKEGLVPALDAVCDSLKAFTKVDRAQSQRDREIEIISNYLNVADPALKELILDYLDPYSERSNALEEMFACFVAYDEAWFADAAAVDGKTVEERFVEHYQACVQKTCDQFAEKLRSNGLHKLTIHFFLLPFPSVKALRTRFFERIGLAPPDDEQVVVTAFPMVAGPEAAG